MSQPCPLLAFKDNYIWTFGDLQKIWVVDPGDAEPVLSALETGKILAGILLTHHHTDHSGGIAELTRHFKDIPIVGSHKSPIRLINHPVHEGDEISCGNLKMQVIEIPGHTLDHIAFYGEQILFCGDTLFSAGCGRLFEGTPEMMCHSLNKLAKLNIETQIFCGHEYTLANLQFAQKVEPDNAAITHKIHWANEVIAQGESTLPSTLQDEKQINPFLRCHVPAVIRAAENYAQNPLPHEVDVFWALREWKNTL